MAISLLFMLTGLILVSITDKSLLHLSANEFVGSSADIFFKNFTHIGDGLTVVILILLASLVHLKNFIPFALLGLVSFAVSGLIAQLLKRLVFNGSSRPIKFFGDHHLKLIEGVELHGSYSFPSGHSTASFALFIFLAFVFKKQRYVQVICAFGAILAAYSRVHISQHFIQDILAGAVLGISCFFIVAWIFNKFEFTKKVFQ